MRFYSAPAPGSLCYSSCPQTVQDALESLGELCLCGDRLGLGELLVDWPVCHLRSGKAGANQTGRTYRPRSDVVFRRSPHSESSAWPSLLMLERVALVPGASALPCGPTGAEGIIGGRPALIVPESRAVCPGHWVCTAEIRMVQEDDGHQHMVDGQ